jgi:hypothetical protein
MRSMMEDRLLIWKFKRGSPDALRRIYEKYKNDLLKLATNLLGRTGRRGRAVAAGCT